MTHLRHILSDHSLVSDHSRLTTLVSPRDRFSHLSTLAFLGSKLSNTSNKLGDGVGESPWESRSTRSDLGVLARAGAVGRDRWTAVRGGAGHGAGAAAALLGRHAAWGAKSLVALARDEGYNQLYIYRYIPPEVWRRTARAEGIKTSSRNREAAL